MLVAALKALQELQQAVPPQLGGSANQQETAAARELAQALTACQSAADDAALHAALLAALPAAEHAAAALQRWWAEPQQAAAARLLLAKAAAARSCANLRCVNLAGFRGGPAAGQGTGCLKCSGCRSVWYCCTACSTANWRAGGHKQACKALAEARQQARQAS